MRRVLFFLLAGSLIHAAAFTQNRQQDAYMVPSKVYVGDRASLALPLPGVVADIKINPGIPASPDMIIHQVSLERRPGGSLLVVEFSAYTPGVLELPPLEIAGEIFSGLRVEISSILSADESDTVLSSPALPLAIPGTSLLIYGTISAAVLLILLAVWVLLWGRRRMEGWLAAWRRKRLLASMLGMERRLRRALAKGVPRRDILDILSTEFRKFLACLTGENCRAMTAEEIGRLEELGEDGMNREFLGGFFSQCDEIRFSGGEINGEQTLAMLGDLRRFLAGLAA
jgi:hypothetical protein